MVGRSQIFILNVGADGSKGHEGHVATPHPAQKAAAGKSDKSKQEEI